jgi:hypothetical protein
MFSSVIFLGSNVTVTQAGLDIEAIIMCRSVSVSVSANCFGVWLGGILVTFAKRDPSGCRCVEVARGKADDA